MLPVSLPCSGYAGPLSAAAALDAVVQEPSAVLIDIRSIREKEASGVPDVPGAASGKVRALRSGRALRMRV